MKSISENGKNFNLLANEEANKIKGCQPLDNNNSKNGTFLNCTDIYVLQKSMQDWFYKSSKFYDDYSSLKQCGSLINRKNVQIKLGKDSKAFFHGYMTCNNNWLCPVCSKRIAYLRGLEVLKAGQWALANGYSLAMVTLTNQHTRRMLPELCVDIQLSALKLFRIKAKRWLCEVSIGRITGNEILHGENGCHFHSHILLILKNGCTISADLEKKLRCAWADSLIKSGLKGSSVKVLSKKAMDIQLDCSVSSYISKWGVDKEITASGSKQGHGISLFEVFASGDYSTFFKYAMAFSPKRNRSIHQQIYKLRWSYKLKELVGLKSYNDSEIQEDYAKESILVAVIGADAWEYICENNLKKAVLEAVEHGGYEELMSMLYCHGIELNCFSEFSVKNYLSMKEGR